MFNRYHMLIGTCVLFTLSTIVCALDTLSLSLNAPSNVSAGELIQIQAHVTSPDAQQVTLQFRDQSIVLPANLSYFEAESLANAKYVVDDNDASGNKAIKLTGDYQVAFKLPFPQDGKTYNVWYRARGASFCLKGSDDDTGKISREIQWNWSKPASWQWLRYKPVTPQQAGKILMLMKSPKSEGFVDAVILTSDETFTPNNTLTSPPNVLAWQTLPTSVGKHTLTVTAICGDQSVMQFVTVDVTPAPVTEKPTEPTTAHPIITSAKAVDLSSIAITWDKQVTPFAINTPDFSSLYISPVMGMKLSEPTGLIALQCKQYMDLPNTVTIPVGQKAAGLAFVHTQYMQRDPFHAVAAYNITYDDGTIEPILLREEVNLAGSLRPAHAAHAHLLKTIGHNGVDYHLFLYAWVNPHPDKTIKQIVFTNQINRDNAEENTTLGFNVADATSQILLNLSIIADMNQAVALRDAINSQSGKLSNIANASIDFAQIKGHISQALFSTNETDTLSLRNRKDDRFDEYKQLLDEMGCNNIRLHSGFALAKIFPTPDTEGDFTLLDERVAALKADMPNRDIMMCINRIPAYIDPTKEQDRQTFATLVGKLLAHVNANEKTRINYWEIYNEPFSKVIPEDRSLWKMYNLTAQTMRKIDANIKIGGYAPCWPILDAMKDFYEHCHENVDFISWHKYPTGNSQTPTDHLMKGTDQFGKDVQNVRNIINSITPGKHVELALTEYHINFNWRPHDPRQATNVGSTWMASVLYHMIINDMDIAQSWHSRSGGTFGMFSRELEVRPTGHLLHILNQHMRGQYVHSVSDNAWVEVLGFVPGKDKTGLLLINKSDIPQTLHMELLNTQLPASNAFDANARCYRIGPRGYSVEDHWLWRTATVEMLPYEVRLIVTD